MGREFQIKTLNLLGILYNYKNFINLYWQISKNIVIRNDEKSILKYSKKIAGLFINVRD